MLGAVRRHLFNNDTWPDFTRIPDHLEPSVRFQEIVVEEPFSIGNLPSGALEITAIPVNHIVPTTAFLLRQGSSSIIFTSDTGPTDRIWEVANETPDLKALITECSFPDRLQAVADISLHLTPGLPLLTDPAPVGRDRRGRSRPKRSTTATHPPSLSTVAAILCWVSSANQHSRKISSSSGNV